MNVKLIARYSKHCVISGSKVNCQFCANFVSSSLALAPKMLLLNPLCEVFLFDQHIVIAFVEAKSSVTN